MCIQGSREVQRGDDISARVDKGGLLEEVTHTCSLQDGMQRSSPSGYGRGMPLQINSSLRMLLFILILIWKLI